MIFSWHHDFLRMELTELSRYAESLEKLLEDEASRVASDLSRQAEELPELQRGEFFERYSDDYFRLRDAFPNILRYSLFVHCYSLLEHGLLGVANSFRFAQKLELAPNDLRDGGITRAQTYLKKVAHVKFPDMTVAWRDIVTLNDIRNAVVHRNGYFAPDDSKRQVQELIGRWPETFSLDHNGRCDFGAAFNGRVIGTFETFLDDLFANLKTRRTHLITATTGAAPRMTLVDTALSASLHDGWIGISMQSGGESVPGGGGSSAGCRNAGTVEPYRDFSFRFALAGSR